MRLTHADSLGNNRRLEPDAAQVMPFSHGADMHSEKNGSPNEADLEGLGLVLWDP